MKHFRNFNLTLFYCNVQTDWLQTYFQAPVHSNSVVPPSHLFIQIQKVTNHLIYTFAEKGICLSVVLSILSQPFLRVAAQERSYKLCSCLALLVVKLPHGITVKSV